MSRLRIHQLGDTLIEVFFAMAVLSAVLGGAYVAASRGLQLGRLAQERGEATKLVEGQIESIKYFASKNRPLLDSMKTTGPPPNKMCVNADATAVLPSSCVNGFYTISVYNESSQAISNCTDLTLTPHGGLNPTHPDQFLICAVWDGPGSFINQEVGIRYRVH